ncbi:MAG: hypothetical protein SAK29_41505, partial [Scytonema sp. PMC 1069.18]|nr:hypothetical protein [Scytonema sp. PMC 1069.18]
YEKEKKRGILATSPPIYWLCNLHDGEIVVLNNSKLSPHDELMQDFMSIMHCFSSKLYFLRRYEKKVEQDDQNSLDKIDK